VQFEWLIWSLFYDDDRQTIKSTAECRAWGRATLHAWNWQTAWDSVHGIREILSATRTFHVIIGIIRFAWERGREPRDSRPPIGERKNNLLVRNWFTSKVDRKSSSLRFNTYIIVRRGGLGRITKHANRCYMYAGSLLPTFILKSWKVFTIRYTGEKSWLAINRILNINKWYEVVLNDQWFRRTVYRQHYVFQIIMSTIGYILNLY